MDGEMPNYLLAKDLILQIIGEISVSGATYKAMEFVGTTVDSLTMEEMSAMCDVYEFCEKEIHDIRCESQGLLSTKFSHSSCFIFPGPSSLENLKGTDIFINFSFTTTENFPF